MTDESRGNGGTVGPPWSVDVLADLHSGVLDEQEAAELWPRVRADPEASAILEALDATTGDLSGLATEDVAPMPAEVANRIDDALARERQAQGSNVVSMAIARKRRNRRLGWASGLLTTAAAVVAAVVVIGPGIGNDSDPGLAQKSTPPPTEQPPGGPSGPALALSSADAGAAVGDIQGVRDFGPLGTEKRLDACLAANDLDPNRDTEGVRPATLDGRPAVLVLYTTGNLAEFRLVGLSADCGPDNPGLLLDKTVGGTGG